MLQVGGFARVEVARHSVPVQGAGSDFLQGRLGWKRVHRHSGGRQASARAEGRASAYGSGRRTSAHVLTGERSPARSTGELHCDPPSERHQARGEHVPPRSVWLPFASFVTFAFSDPCTHFSSKT